MARRWCARSSRAASPRARGAPTCSRPGTPAFVGDPCRHSLSVRRAGPSLRLRPAARCRQGRRNAPALPLPAQRHDADPAGHQRLWLSRAAGAVRAPARGRCASPSSAPRPRSAVTSFPYSYPEFIGNWLNLWADRAQARRQVRGAECRPREASPRATTSRSCARRCCRCSPTSSSITRAPTSFSSAHHRCRAMPQRAAAQPMSVTVAAGAPAAGCASLQRIRRWCAALQALLADAQRARRRRRMAQAGLQAGLAGGRRRARSRHRDAPDLPVNLSTILRDLDAIRAACDAVGGRAGAGIVRLAGEGRHGARSDPPSRDPGIPQPGLRAVPLSRSWSGWPPSRTACSPSMRAPHKLAFIDVARLMPFDPDLFVDAIHNTYAGERLRAWVFFQAPGADRGEPSEKRRVAQARSRPRTSPRRSSRRGPSPSAAGAILSEEMPAPAPGAPAFPHKRRQSGGAGFSPRTEAFPSRTRERRG